MTSEPDLHDALRMSWASLRRYKLMQLLCLAAALLLAIAYLALRPGSYTATARVLVDNRVLAIAQQDAVYSTSALTPQLVQSQVEILRSEALAEQVIDRLNLMQAPEFSAPAELTPAQHRRIALDRFKRRLSVEVVPQSHVVEVRYTSREPQRAADVANALIEAYIQDQTAANSAAAKSSSGWLRGNMRALGTTGRVLGNAMAPVNRDGPAAPIVLAFAALAGLVAGATAALLRGFLDRRIQTDRDIQRATGHIPIAVVPLASQDKGARPLLTRALQAPKSQFAHAINRVAASVGTVPDGRATVVGVVALRAGGGATLVSANVARAAARAGKCVLLVDASRFSGTLTELARDNDRLDDDVLIDPWSGLRFASLLAAPQPAKTLAALLEQQRDSLDLVVVDLPALEPSPEASEFLSSLDRVILVLAAGEAERDDLRNDIAVQPLLHEKLAGIVLNKVRTPRAKKTAPFYHDEGFTADAPPLMFVPEDDVAGERPEPHEADGKSVTLRRSKDGGVSVHSTVIAVLTALLFGWLSLSPGPALAEAYRLATGDTLRIKVSEWPDLSGEYTLGAGGQLSLPVIGAIEANGLTVPELAASIAGALQKRGDLQDAPAASVAIVTYRPFFVMGDVQKPGEYAYRPGLTVLQAISVAGGYYRPLETAFRLERDAIAARSDVGREQAAVKRLAARIARFEAERTDVDQIAPPTDFDATPGSADQNLLAQEQTILRANKEALAKLLASLDHYKDLYEQEIKTVTEQIATERQQASAVQRELDSLKGLAERGLSPITRQLTTERTLAQISGTIQGLQATILRARQNIGLTDQRRIDALNARTLRINEGLQQARAEEKDAAQRLRAARALLEEAQVIAPSLQDAAQLTGAVPNFTILRRSDSGVEEIAADRTTDVRPGDVLTVERRRTQQLSRRPDANIGALPDRAATTASSNRVGESR